MTAVEAKRLKAGDIVRARMFGKPEDVVIASYPFKIEMFELCPPDIIFHVWEENHRRSGWISHGDIIEVIGKVPDNQTYGGLLKQVA